MGNSQEELLVLHGSGILTFSSHGIVKQKGKHIIRGKNTLLFINKVTEKIGMLINVDEFSSCVLDNKTGLWVGSNYGLLHFPDYRHNPTTFQYYDNGNIDGRNSLSSDQIIHLFIDKSDVLWIGTYG